MRCESCSKFVSMEFEEPELEDSTVVPGMVSVSVRVYRVCADCGQEMKEAHLDQDLEYEMPEGHEGDGHELSLEDETVGQYEESGGRYKKSFFGYEYSAKVKCSCGTEIASVEGQDKIAASDMDEL